MRIDRERFLLLAITTLAACERDVVEEITPEPFDAPGVAEQVRMTLLDTELEPAPPPKPLSPLEAWFTGLSVAQRDNVVGFCGEVTAHPCAAVAAMVPVAIDEGPNKRPPVVDPYQKFLSSFSVAQRDVADRYCFASKGMPMPSCECPLVVALDNQPVEYLPAAGDAFAFVPGKPRVSDWPTAATPWIARDLDGDGAITSGAELFGTSTALAAASGGNITASNGFHALAALDANGDGTIDARDPAFAELLLWADGNGDRVSSPSELHPLADVVSAISLDYTLDPRCTERGACEGERGTLRWHDPTGVDHAGAVIDVYVPALNKRSR